MNFREVHSLSQAFYIGLGQARTCREVFIWRPKEVFEVLRAPP